MGARPWRPSVLPDSKSGPRTIWLALPARAIPAAQPRRDGCPWVFASDDGKAVSIEKPWRVIRCKAGLASLRLRDLRHSHAAVAVSSGEGLRIVAGLLGHADIETTFGYAHLAEEAVFAAANRVSRTLADALDRKAPSNGWARPPDRCHRARGAAARNLLDRLSKTRSSEWVFPGTAREGHMSEEALYWFWCGVRDEADIVADARLHDLRHSHASHAIMNGESLHMAGRLLGHRRAAPTNRYAHLDGATLSEVAERVAGEIEGKLQVHGPDALVAAARR